MKHKLINFSKRKIILTVIALALTVSIFAGCSGQENYKEENTANSNSLQTPELSLKLWEEEYLYGEIPAPKTADVYLLSTGTSGEWNVRSFTFKNFSMDEAKEYISILESSLVIREHYDEYYENDYPILNYIGYVNDSLAITLSQCGTQGGVTVNFKNN